MSQAADKKKVAKPAEHPKYSEMIAAAISALKERNGSSRQAITKYVSANFQVGASASTHLKLALKRGVASGKLVQTKGTGASGSFKLAKPEPKKKPAAKKPAAKKPAAKKPAAKKPAAKKTAAKKSTPKKKAAKSTPKKAAKKPAKKASAKKAKKPATKKPAAKKVKKTPKKKAAAKK